MNSGFKTLLFILAWIEKAQATRISTGKAWRLHNVLAGSYWVSVFLVLAAVSSRVYLVLALGVAVLQVVVYFRGYYFGDAHIIP
jgi:hypothetical protein